MAQLTYRAMDHQFRISMYTFRIENGCFRLENIGKTSVSGDAATFAEVRMANADSQAFVSSFKRPVQTPKQEVVIFVSKTALLPPFAYFCICLWHRAEQQLEQLRVQ